ncbi:class I adenylate-forming enzyme family protein [Caenimonas sp. SL110]|uniref:class I adenylate-forming enzyme family protein n=1 Tax=Caenimonas sp. SL110 TaxID=1450524 RepID=UPI000652BFB9|nr:long-chain fatty acid--CoA ligase [Caenimonas sp. SL110]
MNVLDSIARQARAHPDRTAVINDGDAISYSALWRSAAGVAAHLVRAGIQQGQCVAVSGLRMQADLVVVMALARIGAISTYFRAGQTDAVRREIFARNQVVAWIGHPDAIGGDDIKLIPIGDLVQPLGEDAVLPPLVSGLDDQVWRIASSSGTTGVSKSIPFTHARTARQQQLSFEAWPIQADEKLLLLADLGIGFSLGHCMQQLSAGATVVFLKELLAPEMAASLKRDRPTRILSTPAVMTRLTGYLRRLPESERFKPDSLRSVMLGGSIVPPGLRAEVRQLLCPNLIVNYGSTEMGSTARAGVQIAREHPGAAGRLVPWVEGQAVDVAGNPLPPGQTGILRFRSPVMVQGYVGDEKATAAAFRDGWFYPGDTGSIDEGRIVRLGGRSDDVINLLGVKLDPSRVEEALNSHPSVKESAVTLSAQASRRPVLVLLVVAADESAPPQESALKAHVIASMGSLHEPSRVQVVASLPRTDAGKLARAQLPSLADGTQARGNEIST